MWNYRVCRETVKDVVCYSVREVHYNESDRESIWGISESYATISEWEFLSDLQEKAVLKDMETDIYYLSQALSKPIIDLDTLELDDYDEDY